MSLSKELAVIASVLRACRKKGSSRIRVLDTRESERFTIPTMIWCILLICAGPGLSAGELSPDKFRKIVQAEVESAHLKSDSIGTVMRVMAFGERARDFMLVPVILNGKVVAVYKDDPKRGGVTLLAGEGVLRSVRPELFSQNGARGRLQDRGYPSGDPLAISVGPCSLLGVLETGWYLAEGESFILMSLEGRIVSESDVARFWPDKLAVCRQIGRRLSATE